MGDNQDIEEEVETQRVLGKLEDTAHEGALWSDWGKTYCSQKLFKYLDEQIQLSKNAWLSATEDEARAIRYRTQSYAMIKSWVASHIQAGNLAGAGIKKFHEEGIELQGLIKPPPAK